jgi:hypothetical protein
MPDDDTLTLLSPEQLRAESSATRHAALLGALIGLLSCAATRLGTIWYARATLPAQSEMGERFAVGLPILISAGGVFLVSLVLTVVVVAAVVRRAQAWQPRYTLRVSGIVGLMVVLWVALTSNGFLFELALVGLWAAIHGLFASTRGAF